MVFVYIAAFVIILLCLSGFVWNHKKDKTGWNEDDDWGHEDDWGHQ